MQQHPIPQNITAFEFKLVGPMTLKQFLYLAGPGIVCFILFVSIGGLLKWLFMIPIALLGLALAFVPILGMPFDKWVVVFIAAISNPARRVWFKEPKTISFLAPEFSYYLRRAVAAKPLATSDRSRLKAFFGQIQSQKRVDGLDIFERAPFSSLDFGEGEEVSDSPAQSITPQPNIDPLPTEAVASKEALGVAIPEGSTLAGPAVESPESEHPLVLTESSAGENIPEKRVDQEMQRKGGSHPWRTHKPKAR